VMQLTDDLTSKYNLWTPIWLREMVAEWLEENLPTWLSEMIAEWFRRKVSQVWELLPPNSSHYTQGHEEK